MQIKNVQGRIKTDWRWWGLGVSVICQLRAYSNLCIHIGPWQIWAGVYIDTPIEAK